MKKENFFEKLADLKNRFSNFFQHRKKVTALENYSVSDKFHHKKYLVLVKQCMQDGFLEQEESEFLDHMLKKYEMNYLDWTHRTKWVKGKMAEMAPQKPKPVQTYFDFKQPACMVPAELLAQKGLQGVRFSGN